MAVGNRLYVIGRSISGVYAYYLESGAWKLSPVLQAFPDKEDWDQPQYYKTVKAVAVGQLLYVIGRGSKGLYAYFLDSGAWGSRPIIDAFTDKQGWDQPKYYETIQPVAVSDSLYVFGRGSLVVYVYRWDSTIGWVLVPNAPAWSDDKGWDKPACYRTIQGLALANKLCLVGRGPSGYTGSVAE